MVVFNLCWEFLEFMTELCCELGAFTYLLKPIEDSKLEEAVLSAANAIRQRRKSRKILQDYEHFIENNRKVFENYMVGKFSGDQIDEEELQEALARFGGSGFSDAGCVDGLLIGACDEGDQYGDSHRSHQFNVGTWGPQNQEEFNLTRAIQGMRNASIFIDNVDNVPLGASGSYN